jgi:transposase
MAMGTRKQREKQEDIWIAHRELPSGPGHPFYQRLNELLEAEKFDEFVEKRCAKFYAAKYGRPSLTPGIYFRSLLLGYFEGIDSERGIAWQLADSLGLRRFVGIGLDEGTPDHTTISRTRRLIDVETHREVFGWVLGVLADRGLVKGKRIAIDATTLEANAAMRSIVRRDTGESYEEFLRGLAKASGIETPNREDLARLDRKRKKRMSNKEWESPADGDARIAKMKDGRTHLAHKAEHAVDLDTGAVVAVTLHEADLGDTVTLDATLSEAGMAVAELVKRETEEQRPEDTPKVNVEGIEEVVADKGYHSGAVLERVKSYEVRTYIPEKKQAGQRHWEGKTEEQQAVYQNRRRVRGGYGKSLLRRRGQLVERSFAHCYETGGMRRTHLRGHENILKRQHGPCGGVQLEPDPAASAGCGHAAAVERSRVDLFFAVYLLLTRQENRHRLSGRRISISCTKSVTESRSSTRSSARLVVPKISYLHPGLLGSFATFTVNSCTISSNFPAAAKSTG